MFRKLSSNTVKDIEDKKNHVQQKCSCCTVLTAFENLGPDVWAKFASDL